MGDAARLDEEFDVGGVRLPRPFKLLRLGHFGVNAIDPEAARDFYCRILGFRVSDPIDFGARFTKLLVHAIVRFVERGHGHDEPGRAVAALRAVTLHHRLLHG